ncbi:MAG: Ig-like domain-containing protein [Candidatus Accumulibacter sp.]|uniref:Ig-like domain-containing protein n=1 Tax=Candidatus Accumulibacter proximus TaxID=2954385 RepID=A0A935PZZ6_9PROT|nr:Ig-like domain-containing protein [Candidatus Accumulibacter proximus]
MGSVSVADASYTNAAGNIGTGHNDTVTIDTAPPVPTITLDADITADDILNAAEATASITVTGKVGGDAKVGDTVTLTVNGQTFTGNIVDTAGVLTFAIAVPGADLLADADKTITASITTTDAAGNSATADDSEGYSVDTTAPSVLVDIVDASLNNGDKVSTVTFTFSDAPSGFDLTDVTAVGGTLSGLAVSLTDPKVYTALFTANDGFTGIGSVSVADASYTNAAGNSGTGHNDTVVIDTAPPLPTITLDADITADDILNASEATASITVTGKVGGDAKAGDTVTLTVNGQNFTGTVVDTAGVLTFAIAVPGADLSADADRTIDARVTTTDAAGNSATADDSEGYSVDTAPPLPTITLDANITADDILNAAEATASITVTGTVGGDAKVGDTVTLTVNGQNFTGLVVNNAGVLGFAIAVPGADLSADADKTIAASITTTDAAGNSGSASDSEGYTVDTAAPSVVVDIVDTSLNSGDKVSTVTFTFSDAPSGFDLTDVTAVGGTLSGLAVSLTDPKVYTALFTATDGFTGIGSVSVADASYTNAAGNLGTGNNDTVAIDTAPPLPTITLDADITADDILNAAEIAGNVTVTGTVGGDAKVGDTVTLTVNGQNFTGPVVNNAGVLGFAIAVPGADLLADGDKTIAASITTTDAAGNSGSASDSEGYTVDTTPPLPTITLDADITADDILNAAEATASITVTGKVGGDAKAGDTVTLTVNGQTFTGTVVDTAGVLTFAIAVPGADLLADADKTITASITTTDAAGNSGSASDSEGYTVAAAPRWSYRRPA